VMEGKACLFKKFAGIDVFDLELAERDPDKLVDIIAALEPTFGGINLEDIKAPECFDIERKLRARMKIPVFHDDQHGTAIIVAAALLNGLKIVGKDLAKIKLVTSGAGAAALACIDLLVTLGLPIANVFVTDIEGVVHAGRTEEMDPFKARYAQETEALATSVPDTGGVHLVPAFVGLGAPYWNPEARGAVLGITRGTSRAHVVRAALESIAFQSAEMVHLMANDVGKSPPTLRVDGGATANNFLCQFQADLAGVPVERPQLLETTAARIKHPAPASVLEHGFNLLQGLRARDVLLGTRPAVSSR